jgi:hypothetical protein
LSSGLTIQGSYVDSDEVLELTANDWFITPSISSGLAVHALDSRALELVRELEEAIFEGGGGVMHRGGGFKYDFCRISQNEIISCLSSIVPFDLIP